MRPAPCDHIRNSILGASYLNIVEVDFGAGRFVRGSRKSDISRAVARIPYRGEKLAIDLQREVLPLARYLNFIRTIALIDRVRRGPIDQLVKLIVGIPAQYCEKSIS